MEPKNPSEPSFAQRVEEALLQVPPGRVVTYGGLALLAGDVYKRQLHDVHIIAAGFQELSADAVGEQRREPLLDDAVDVYKRQ